jgi:hypothetical protein
MTPASSTAALAASGRAQSAAQRTGRTLGRLDQQGAGFLDVGGGVDHAGLSDRGRSERRDS